MKDKPMRRKLIIELLDERFECRALEPQAELGDAAFEEIWVAQRCPIGSFHFAKGISSRRRSKSAADSHRYTSDDRLTSHPTCL
jgi:hypothetical protein